VSSIQIEDLRKEVIIQLMSVEPATATLFNAFPLLFGQVISYALEFSTPHIQL
jgi:hypothetical protein